MSRNKVPVKAICREIGVNYRQVVEFLRRVDFHVRDGSEVITQEVGTFYLKKSQPTTRTLNGVTYDVPAREAVALRGKRFPGREVAIDCNDFAGDGWADPRYESFVPIRVPTLDGRGRTVASVNSIFQFGLDACGERDANGGVQVNGLLDFSVGFTASTNNFERVSFTVTLNGGVVADGEAVSLQGQGGERVRIDLGPMPPSEVAQQTLSVYVENRGEVVMDRNYQLVFQSASGMSLDEVLASL